MRLVHIAYRDAPAPPQTPGHPVNRHAPVADPRLAGAACAGRWPVFDLDVHGETPEDREARHHQARAVCRTCTVTAACHHTAQRLDRRAEGVWAGTLRGATNRPGRPKGPTS